MQAPKIIIVDSKDAMAKAAASLAWVADLYRREGNIAMADTIESTKLQLRKRAA